MYVLLRNKLNNSTNFLDITKARNADLLQFSTYTNPILLKKSNIKFYVIHQNIMFQYRIFLKQNEPEAIEAEEDKETKIIEEFLHNKSLP